MSKKILILETSVTLQKLFTTTLDGDDYSIQFATNGKEALYALFDYLPDLFLVNCDIEEPRSFEVVKIVRSIHCFKELTIGMYANFPTPLDEVFAKESGANSFVRLDPKTLVLNVDELAELQSSKVDKLGVTQIKKNLDDYYFFLSSTDLLCNSSYKNAMFSKIISMMNKLENIEEMVETLLLLIAEVCEVPAVGLFIVENDGPHGYYVCSENIGEKEIADFLKVCAADFEKELTDFSASKVIPKKLTAKSELNRFYNEQVQLSSYENVSLKSDDGSRTFGSVHIVSEGNITKEKQDYFNFCVSSAGPIFDKAVIVEKKMFFEKRIRRAFSRFVPEQIIDNLIMTLSLVLEKPVLLQFCSVTFVLLRILVKRINLMY